MTDPTGSTAYTYERRGRLASTVQTVNTTACTTSYTYDGNGNRTTVTLPSSHVLTYAFDFADRPMSVKFATTNYVTAAAYLPFGPLTSLTFGNGTSQTRSYTQRYLPSEISLTAGATTLSDVTYTENGAGFITAATDKLNAGYNRAYTTGGNAGNALVEADSGASLWGTGQITDSYADNIGTISLKGHNYGYSYDSNLQLTSVYNSDTNASSSVSHDLAGNQTAYGASTYSYSPRNLLATGEGIAYVYDGFGQRVSGTRAGSKRVSLYNPSHALQSDSVINSQSSFNEYIWFAGLPVAQANYGASTYWTACDDLGAPFLQTDSSSHVHWQADYEPYGSVYSLRTPDSHQPLRRPGQEVQDFTGTAGPNGDSQLYYNGARWYQPAVARYTQPDPLRYGGGNPYNLYTYALDNPIAYVDPSGLAAFALPGGGSFGGGIGSIADDIAGAASALGDAAAAYGPVADVVAGAAIDVALPAIAVGAVGGALAFYLMHGGGAAASAGDDANGGTAGAAIPGSTAAADGAAAGDTASPAMPAPPENCGSGGASSLGQGTGSGGGSSGGEGSSGAGGGESGDPANSQTNSPTGGMFGDVLTPGGEPLGVAGSNPNIREINGSSATDAQNMYDELSQGGTPYAGKYTGTAVNLPNGGFVGIRPGGGVKSPNTITTIDVDLPDFPGIFKIKFNP